MTTDTFRTLPHRPIKPIKRRLLIAAAVVTVALASTFAAMLSASDDAPFPDKLKLASLTTADLSNAPPARKSIPVIEARLADSPDSYLDHVTLAQLHLQNARDGVDPLGVQNAETSVKKALELNAEYPGSIAAHARVLSAQHRFHEAREWAEKALAYGASRKQGMATLADILIATGEYEEADRVHFELAQIAPGAAIDARLANVESLYGNTELALDYATQSAEGAYRSGSSPTQMAWYLWRIGVIHFESGAIDDAATYFQAARRLHGDHFLYIDAVAGTHAANGEFEAAIKLYRESIEKIRDPASFAALTNLYLYLGRTEDAANMLADAEVAARLEMAINRAHNLEHAIFFADHDIHLGEALSLAIAELDIRQDIGTYDGVAWIHYKNGLFADAVKFIEKALVLGTRDATLHFHAGMIYASVGDDILARLHLSAALDINPHFSLIQAATARAELARLNSPS